MTLRLDLRKRPNLAHPGEAWRDRPVLAAEPFGCADCGQWFAFASGPLGLVAHLRDCPTASAIAESGGYLGGDRD